MPDITANLQNAAKAVLAWKPEELAGKSPLRSRTVWVLIVAWLACLCSQYLGLTLSAEEQTAIVVLVGIALRLVTKQPVGFWEDAQRDSNGTELGHPQ